MSPCFFCASFFRLSTIHLILQYLGVPQHLSDFTMPIRILIQ